ncbi:hypothetical protein CIK05_15530 [Bdellovibrio sp. qaytius]|nr:hypothetical protein CIK05_15530 [Bdellovibrio sp. qaytius]
MDNLNLPSSLLLIWEVKRTIEKNLSLQQGLQKFSQRMTHNQTSNDEFAKNFMQWWQIRQKTQVSELSHFNAQHRAVITLLENGLRGQSIYEPLKALEADFVEMCDADIQEHAAKLPLLLQIPLIFLVFPAICILLLVPTLCQLAF